MIRWILKPYGQVHLNMELIPDTWYPFDGLFHGSSVRLRDGSFIQSSERQFRNSVLQALTGVVIVNQGGPAVPESTRCHKYLQLTLLDIQCSDLDRLPQPPALAPRLFREHMLHVSDSGYAYDIHIRDREQIYYSKGAVCVCLTLKEGYRSDRLLREKDRDVQTAFQRGLLDEFGRSKATFRLHIKPMMRKLVALRDSGYLPDDEYQVDVVFAHWYTGSTDELVTSPIGSECDDTVSSDQFEIQFKQQTRPRDFRVADLFKT